MLSTVCVCALVGVIRIKSSENANSMLPAISKLISLKYILSSGMAKKVKKGSERKRVASYNKLNLCVGGPG